MEEILTKIDDIIITYQSGAWVSSENLRIMLRELVANKYHLTKHNIEAFREWNIIVYNFKGSNAAGETKAHHDIPELRMTRKILEACKDNIMGMQQELSIIKNDK